MILDRIGGIEVVALQSCAPYGAFSCLQIMNMSMREAAERPGEVIVQLEWVHGYERLFDCYMSEETRRALLEHPQRRRRGSGD